MKVLVVTGGIGSGKSEVCRILTELGVRGVYDADTRAKSLYEAVPGLLDAMESELGLSLRDDDGRFVPAQLAAVVFADGKALETVERLLFPVMLEDFNGWVQEYSADPLIVFESATILDKPFFKGFGDFVLLVDAPLELRRRRASLRDDVDEGLVQKRIDRQKAVNELSGMSVCPPEVDYIIVNDGGQENLREKVEKLMKILI